MDLSLPPTYFDDLYRRSPDPWQFRGRWYEQRKRAVTLAALPERHYRSGFEPGCSIGLLSAGLAARCQRLVAMDVSEQALATAAQAVPGNVELVAGAVPRDWPGGTFDLVVLSEIGYYLSVEDCRELAHKAAGAAGDLLAVHWRHPVADYPLNGDEVQEMLAVAADHAGLRLLAQHLEADFRLELWSRDSRSVAARTGVPGA